MELKILGSSSAGNCYLLDNGKETLMIECGVSFRKVLEGMNFDVGRIAGCIVSHEHGDHSKGIPEALKYCIPVAMSKGTADALKLPDSNLVKRVEALKSFSFGNFKVMPFKVKHDAAEPFGYLINHPETGTVLFATDTYYLEQTFMGLSNIMLECNYDINILDANIASGVVPEKLRNRTVKSHMSLETCIETLKANDLSGVNNILLIHLSANNSNASEFKKAVGEVTGKNVIIAAKGMNIEFNKEPF